MTRVELEKKVAKFIEEGGKVRTKDIRKMWGLGTPEDLNNFMNNYNGSY